MTKSHEVETDEMMLLIEFEGPGAIRLPDNEAGNELAMQIMHALHIEGYETRPDGSRKVHIWPSLDLARVRLVASADLPKVVLNTEPVVDPHL